MSPVFSTGRLRLLGFGLLVAMFVAGALAGAAVDRVLSADETAQVERNDDDDDRDGRSYIIDRVDMTTPQRAEIDAILERRAKRMRAVWREAEPRLDAITDSARLEIMQVLTPQQRSQYERLLDERHRRRHDRGQRDHQGGDGNG